MIPAVFLEHPLSLLSKIPLTKTPVSLETLMFLGLSAHWRFLEPGKPVLLPRFQGSLPVAKGIVRLRAEVPEWKKIKFN